jgi:transposase-like protein
MVAMRYKSRPPHPPGDQAKLVAAYERSGLSPAQFAQQEGIARSTLYRWLSQHRRLPSSARSDFVEVPNLLSGPPSQSYHLRFPNGAVLELARGFAAEEVRLLAQLLHGL